MAVPVGPAAHPGGRLAVWPVRVADLAEMESWATGLAGDPLAGLESARAIEDEDARRKAMRGVLERAKAWPVTPWSEEWSMAFGSEAGGVALVWFLLKRSFGPGWTMGDAAELMARMTPAEMEAVSSAAWRVDPFRVLLTRTLGGGKPAEEAGGDHDEEERRSALGSRVAMLLRAGIPIESIGAMTLKAFLAATSEEKPGDRLVLPEVDGLSQGQVMRKFREVFGREEDGGPPAPRRERKPAAPAADPVGARLPDLGRFPAAHPRPAPPPKTAGVARCSPARKKAKADGVSKGRS
jgi:hypothetical protein